MACIVPIQRPTSVRLALRMNLLGLAHDKIDVLVLAKANTIEVWNVVERGMEMVCRKAIYGTICMLQALRPELCGAELLFIGTERFQYYTASWKDGALVLGNGINDPAAPYMRASQSINKCSVDPTGRFLALHQWEGVLSLLRVGSQRDSVGLHHMDQVRISELRVRASVFVPLETGHPAIAFLHQPAPDQPVVKLVLYRITQGDGHKTPAAFGHYLDKPFFEAAVVDATAKILIPVPIVEGNVERIPTRNKRDADVRVGGLFVVGTRVVTYVDGLHHGVLLYNCVEPILFCAWGRYDATRYFLGDELGGLYLLQLANEDAVVKGIDLESITVLPDEGFAGGRTSRATTMVYAGEGMLFVASHHGDSQLLRVDVDRRECRLIQVMRNNAPVLDLAVVGMGGGGGGHADGFSGGRTRLVAACGAWEDGSVRTVRSGVTITERGVLCAEVGDVRGLFSVCATGARGGRPDTLVVARATDTRMFRFRIDGQAEEVRTLAGLEAADRTILAGNSADGPILHVSPSRVILLGLRGEVVSNWDYPQGDILMASTNNKQLLVCAGRSALVSLDLMKTLALRGVDVDTEGSPGHGEQIACVHVCPFLEDIGIVGYWNSASISIFALSTMNLLHAGKLRTSPASSLVPRDIALVRLHPPSVAPPTLLVSMNDGSVICFDYDVGGHSLSNRRTVALEADAAGLYPISRSGIGDGTYAVVAAAERPSLIHSDDEGDNRRIDFSALDATGARHFAAFNSAVFPGCVVFATRNEVRIAQINSTIRRPLLYAHPVGGTVRRIAHSPGLRLFGIGCIFRTVADNEEHITSEFGLLDDATQRPVGSPLVLDGSVVSETVAAVAAASFRDSLGRRVDRFLVGTAHAVRPGIVEKHRGRILVLGVDPDRKIVQLAVKPTPGHCRCLAAMRGDYIVAGLELTVVVYSYAEIDGLRGRIASVAQFLPHSSPVDLRVGGNMIGVLDLLNSLVVLEFVPARAGQPAMLTVRARHLSLFGGTALCSLDETGTEWLLGDVHGNLMVLGREDGRELVEIADLNLGEQVNRIQRLDADPAGDSDMITPAAVLATVEGSLYLYCRIKPDSWGFMFGLQDEIAGAVDGLTGGSEPGFRGWRSYRDEVVAKDGPRRFVDGKLIELFRDLGGEAQREVCGLLKCDFAEVAGVVEQLRRLI